MGKVNWVSEISVKAEEVRAKRNILLADSDWRMLPDAPGDKTAWSAYRQGLRDLPEQDGFPENVYWPVIPADEHSSAV